MKAALAGGLTERIDVRRELLSCSLYTGSTGFAIEQLSTRSRSTLLLLAADLPKVSSLLLKGHQSSLEVRRRANRPRPPARSLFSRLGHTGRSSSHPAHRAIALLLSSCALRLLHHSSTVAKKGPLGGRSFQACCYRFIRYREHLPGPGDQILMPPLFLRFSNLTSYLTSDINSRLICLYFSLLVNTFWCQPGSCCQTSRLPHLCSPPLSLPLPHN